MLSRRSNQLRQRLQSMTHRQLLVSGIALLVGSLAFLFAILSSFVAGGMLNQSSVPWWLWPILALLGVGFVHAQAVGTAMLVTMTQQSVTSDSTQASTVEGLESNETASKSRP